MSTTTPAAGRTGALAQDLDPRQTNAARRHAPAGRPGHAGRPGQARHIRRSPDRPENRAIRGARVCLGAGRRRVLARNRLGPHRRTPRAGGPGRHAARICRVVAIWNRSPRHRLRAPVPGAWVERQRDRGIQRRPVFHRHRACDPRGCAMNALPDLFEIVTQTLTPLNRGARTGGRRVFDPSVHRRWIFLQRRGPVACTGRDRQDDANSARRNQHRARSSGLGPNRENAWLDAVCNRRGSPHGCGKSCQT